MVFFNAAAAATEATGDHYQVRSLLRIVERSDTNYAHNAVIDLHHQRHQRQRHLLEFIPDFSISQDDGINIILPILEMRLFGTSGTNISSIAKDIMQSSMDDYLQTIFETNWWSTDSTTTTTTSTTTTTTMTEEQRQDIKPILTNIRSEVMNDNPVCVTNESSSSSARPSCWNMITIQTILTFQDQGDGEEASFGNDNNEFQYSDSSVTTNTKSVPTQTELEAAATDAWTDLSTYWQGYLLPTIQKEQSMTVQEELAKVDSIESQYGRTFDEGDTTTQHNDNNYNTTIPVLSDHHDGAGYTTNSAIDGSSSYNRQQSAIDPKWLIPVVVIATVLCCCIVVIHCRHRGINDKDDDRGLLGCCCYEKTKDVEVCVSWDTTERVDEEQQEDDQQRRTTNPEDFVQEIESNLTSTVSGSIDERPREEESSSVKHATSKEEVVTEILKMSFPDESKKKRFFFY
jgi:hypothetical protein